MPLHMHGERTQKSQSESDRAPSQARLHMLRLKTCLPEYTAQYTCTWQMYNRNTASYKSLIKSIAARLMSPPAMLLQTEPSSLLPCRLQRHQYEMAHHDRPGILSAESFLTPTANIGMTCVLVHVTRTSLGVGLNTTRCCAVTMHEYLSRACEDLLRPTYKELEGGTPERGRAPCERCNITQRSCYSTKVV